MTATPSTTPKPSRRWLQFSLRTLLVFVLLVGISVSLVGVRVQRSRNMQVLAAQFAPGAVDFSEPPHPFSSEVSVRGVYFYLTDADLKRLQIPLERDRKSVV